MLGIKAGNLLEICQRCPDCGTNHPCGQETCQHDFAFAIENEREDEAVLARFLTGDKVISTRGIVAFAWGGWVPEELEDLYDEWRYQHGEGEHEDFDDLDFRHNPPLIRRKDGVYAGKKKLRDATLKSLSENILVIGPFGPVARFFGYSPETHILCFVEKPADKKLLLKVAKGEAEGDIPMFAQRRPIGSRGTIAMFWSRPLNKKILAGAIQYYPMDQKKILVLTHMAVKEKWRRQGLNTQMIEYLKARYPDYQLLFHEPTDDGEAFMKKYGYQEYLP